ADAEIHAERSAFLRRVEAQVGGAENRLDVAARFSSAAIPMLGDWVGMYLLGAEGDYLAAGVAHANREKQDLARMVQERWPPKPESSAIGAAFQTGEEFVFQVVPDEALAQSAEDEEHLAALRQLGIGAGMILPVWEDDEVIAVASFANEPGRHVTEADRHLAVSALALVSAAMAHLPKP
ncbi:MAG: GAF domain-containing protein, partial [Acidimicrobiia bacterium]